MIQNQNHLILTEPWIHVSGNFSLDGTQPFGWKRVNEAGVIDTSDGGKLVRLVEPDDKVGIGTLTPQTELQVVGARAVCRSFSGHVGRIPW